MNPMNSNPSPPDRSMSRRRFVQFAAGGIVAVTGAGLAWETHRRGRLSRGTNPFGMDLERLRQVDPALVHFDPAGRFPAPRPEARRMTADRQGHLHMAAGRYVVTLDRMGTRLGELACPAPVRCVAVSDDQTRYVGFRNHIEVYDPRDRRVAIWEPLEGNPFLTGLALDTDALFAADSGNRLIWHYDRSGRLLSRIGERNPDRNIPGLIVPSPCLDVTVGTDGLLRVSNPGRHRVEVYTTDGRLEFHWGRPSAAIDGFCGCCNPVAIESMPDGRTVTFEKGLPRVKIYSDLGHLESVVAGPDRFPDPGLAETGADPDTAAIGGLDGAVDEAGRVYVLDLLAEEVHMFERSGPAADSVPSTIG
jgi:hypothetical protein